MADKHIAVIEILSTACATLSNAGDINTALRIVSGSEAFRNFNWIRQLPAMNSAGNLRGMVISSDWKAVFQYSSQAGDILKVAGDFVAFAIFLWKAGSQIGPVLQSSDPWDVKASKISNIASSAAIQTLTGIVEAVPQLAIRVLEGYTEAYDAATGGLSSPPGSATKFLRSLDANITSTVHKLDEYTSPAGIAHFVNTYCVLR